MLLIRSNHKKLRRHFWSLFWQRTINYNFFHSQSFSPLSIISEMWFQFSSAPLHKVHLRRHTQSWNVTLKSNASKKGSVSLRSCLPVHFVPGNYRPLGNTLINFHVNLSFAFVTAPHRRWSHVLVVSLSPRLLFQSWHWAGWSSFHLIESNQDRVHVRASTIHCVHSGCLMGMSLFISHADWINIDGSGCDGGIPRSQSFINIEFPFQ